MGRADSETDITRMINEAAAEGASAVERLTPLLYPELRALAERHMKRERADHTLQPTALVNEAYLRLIDQTRVRWQGRAHFMAIAALMIRRILIDHGRRPRLPRVALDEGDCGSAPATIDLLDLDEAIDALERLSARQARVVVLKLFGDLQNTEIAEVLDVSVTTVKNEWRFARAWLGDRLGSGDDSLPS